VPILEEFCSAIEARDWDTCCDRTQLLVAGVA
jgi:hypothetical protein